MLYGGFNPFEISQIGNLPQVGVKIKKIFEAATSTISTINALYGEHRITL